MDRHQFQTLLRSLYPTLTLSEVCEIEDKTSEALLRDDELNDVEKARRATRAWVRHTKTAYDTECRAVSKRFARERARQQVYATEQKLFKGEGYA